MDLSDGQYRDFRNNLKLMTILMILTIIINRFVAFIMSSIHTKDDQYYVFSSIYPRLMIGCIAVLVQHSFHSIIILSIVLVGYKLSKLQSDSTFSLMLIWLFGVSILFLKESYRFPTMKRNILVNWMFDSSFGGLYRWNLAANFLALRYLSYSLDYRSNMQKRSSSIEGTRGEEKALTEADYSFLNYLTYMFYVPLYIAGPIISYDDFIRSMKKPQSQENILLYAVRWIFCMMLMEYLLSRFPFFAVVYSGILPHMNIYQIAVVCYLVLKIMWMKFLLIWRFFRLWAIADGVSCPENMLRCMSNNYSLGQFWRGWHASFNRWLVKYIYNPLGGKDRQLVSVWFIFLFVALWHDLEWKLFVWGLANAFFYVLERYTLSFDLRNQKVWQSKFLAEMLSSVWGAFYIMVLMGVNLVGYSIGTGGMKLLLSKMVTLDGLYMLVVALYFFSVGVSFMHYLEELGWTKQHAS